MCPSLSLSLLLPFVILGWSRKLNYFTGLFHHLNTTVPLLSHSWHSSLNWTRTIDTIGNMVEMIRPTKYDSVNNVRIVIQIWPVSSIFVLYAHQLDMMIIVKGNVSVSFPWADIERLWYPNCEVVVCQALAHSLISRLTSNIHRSSSFVTFTICTYQHIHPNTHTLWLHSTLSSFSRHQTLHIITQQGRSIRCLVYCLVHYRLEWSIFFNFIIIVCLKSKHLQDCWLCSCLIATRP